jgi:hypothetical protein
VKRGERRGSRTVRVCGSKKSRQTQLRRPDALLYVFGCLERSMARVKVARYLVVTVLWEKQVGCDERG